MMTANNESPAIMLMHHYFVNIGMRQNVTKNTTADMKNSSQKNIGLNDLFLFLLSLFPVIITPYPLKFPDQYISAVSYIIRTCRQHDDLIVRRE